MLGRDGNYGSPKIDSAAVELNDLIFRQLRFPPEEFAAAWDIAAAAGGAVKLDDMIFRRTSFPPNELAKIQHYCDYDSLVMCRSS